MSGREDFARFKWFIQHIVSLTRRLPHTIQAALLVPIGAMPGRLGNFGRYVYVGCRAASVGDNVYIAKGTIFKNIHGVEIGNNVSIHEFCYIDGAGGIRIGDNVSIAHGCSILTAEHGWSEKSLPIKYNPVSLAAVSIGNDVWLGCGVRVLSGVTIGERVVVGAGAVVCGDLEGSGVHVGVPARLVRQI